MYGAGVFGAPRTCREHEWGTQAKKKKEKERACRGYKRADRVEMAREVIIAKGGYSKRNIASPAERTRGEEYKKPRRGDVTYAEASRRENKAIRGDFSEDS